MLKISSRKDFQVSMLDCGVSDAWSQKRKNKAYTCLLRHKKKNLIETYAVVFSFLASKLLWFLFLFLMLQSARKNKQTKKKVLISFYCWTGGKTTQQRNIVLIEIKQKNTYGLATKHRGDFQPLQTTQRFTRSLFFETHKAQATKKKKNSSTTPHHRWYLFKFTFLRFSQSISFNCTVALFDLNYSYSNLSFFFIFFILEVS